MRWFIVLFGTLIVFTASSLQAQEAQKTLEQWLSIQAELDQELGQVGQNCTQATQVLNQWMNKHRKALPDLAHQVELILDTLPEAQSEVFEQKQAALMERLINLAILQCLKDDAFQDAYDALDDLLSGKEDDPNDLADPLTIPLQ